MDEVAERGAFGCDNPPECECGYDCGVAFRDPPRAELVPDCGEARWQLVVGFEFVGVVALGGLWLASDCEFACDGLGCPPWRILYGTRCTCSSRWTDR